MHTLNKKKKAQTSVEFLIVTGIALILILPAAYLFLTSSEKNAAQAVENQVYSVGNDIMDASTELYILGDESWLTLELSLPEEVIEVNLTNSTPDSSDLVFKYGTPEGVRKMVIFSDGYSFIAGESRDPTKTCDSGDIVIPRENADVRIQSLGDGTIWLKAKCVSTAGTTGPTCGSNGCETGETCSTCPADCGTCPTGPSCGDGVLDTGEQCDDNNLINNDGCDSNCQVEPNWTCDNTVTPSDCTYIGATTQDCGNRIVEGTETCDDGQTPPVSGDGCDATCQTESGWTCDNTVTPSNCTQNTETCNDNIQNQDETGIDCGGSICAPCVINNGGDLMTNPLPGNYEDVVHVWLESNIPGADIYYTTDGSTPTTSSKEYFKAIELRDTTDLKAIAVLPGTNQEENFSGTYSISKSPSTVTVSGNTYIEAESSKTFENFIARPDSSASNGEYMLVLDEQGGPKGYLEYNFNGNAGKYYVWVRCSDQDSWGTIHLDVDGTESGNLHCGPEANKVNGWGLHWMEPQSSGFAVSGTSHTLKVKESYYTSKIDRILITSDGSYVPPELVVIRPAGGEVLLPSSPEQIKWESTGTLQNVKIEYSTDDGKTWQTITSSTPNDGAYTWTTPSGTYDKVRVRISDVTDSASKDISDFTFRIQNDKEWYKGSETFYSRISSSYNKNYDPDKDNRTLWLADMENLGAEKRPLYHAFNGIKITTYDPSFNISRDQEGMDAFLRYNDNKSFIEEYSNLFSVDSRKYGEGTYIPPYFQADGKNFPEEWMLHDANGEIVYNSHYGIDTTSPECDQCRATETNCEGCKHRPNFFFANPDFIEYFTQAINNNIKAGFKGNFFDSFSPLTLGGYENGNLKYVNGDKMTIMDPRTGAPYKTRDWINDIRHTMYKLKQGVDREQGNKNVGFIYNGLKQSNLMEYPDIIKGALKEGYCSDASGIALSDYWYSSQLCRQDINALIVAEDLGKWGVLDVGPVPTQDNDNQAAYYSLGAALMGIKGPDTNFYTVSYKISGFDNWPGFDLPLSMFIPEGRYQENDGVLVRDFQKARVYVNINKVSKSISFGNSYYYLKDDGTKSTSKISSTNLGSNRAIILFLQ